MRLNGLANSDATRDHRAVVCKVEHEKVSFVTEDFGDFNCAFFADAAISQM